MKGDIGRTRLKQIELKKVVDVEVEKVKSA